MTPRPCPYFVCGPSRSGTALVRSILNRQPDVHIAGETHYFDDLRPRLGPRALSGLRPDEAAACEDYFLALGHRPYGHKGVPDLSRHGREALGAKAREVGGAHPGGDAYFEAFCRLEAELQGATIWGEKTPRHVFRIKEMLEAFPSGKVVCMVRDPRAVVASYRDWENQGGFDLEADPEHASVLKQESERAKKSYHPVLLTLLWRGAIGASFAALDRFGSERVRVQRYEDLVDHPEAACQELAAWIGAEYSASMLSVPMHNSSYAKFDQNHGVSSAPKDRWRSTLSEDEICAIESVCGRLLVRSGYEAIAKRRFTASTVWHWTTMPLAAARAAGANRSRIANLPSYIWRRIHAGA